MQLILNLILLVTTLVYLSVTHQVYFTKLPGGDAGMSWAWNIIYSYLMILILLLVVTWIIAWRGGYDWLHHMGKNTMLYSCLGSIIITLGSALASFMKDEPSPFSVLGNTISYVSSAALLVCIVCSFILVNRNENAAPFDSLRLPLYGSVIAGALSIGLFGLNLFFESLRNQRNRIKSSIERSDANDVRMIKEIESSNVLSDVDFLRIMVFADDNKDSSVVNKAVYKIKSRPDWQETMVKYLKSDGALEVFNFLASQEVPNKEMFPDAINTGLYSLADWIRMRIEECSQEHHFYTGQFSWEVERALRSADKFNGEVDFRPAVAEIKKALLHPHPIKRTAFDCIRLVDQWLTKNK